MGRKWFVLWHALFSLAAGVLYFYCVLPRWYELTGDMSRSLGMAGRIASGALIALAALPVVFVLLRTRKPELGVPQLALSLRTWSVVAHVLAGVLVIGTAISEIWLSLDAVGRILFAIYGAAAAIALLGVFAFHLSFVAELPPPPPKPLKPKAAKKRRLGRKKGDEADAEDAGAAEEPTDPEAAEPEAEGAEDSEEAEETETAQPDVVAEDTADTEGKDKAEAKTRAGTVPEAAPADTDEPSGGLRNRRPTGKGSHRMRRRRTRGGVALDE